MPVKSLDNIVGEFEPVLIKIDVEGWETEVIAGAERTLSNQSLLAVIMELNGSGKQYGYDELALHNLMIDYGFKSFYYLPFNRQLVPLEDKNTQSGNTLYIRDIESVIERVKTASAFLIYGQQI
jgi:hypothetical protein